MPMKNLYQSLYYIAAIPIAYGIRQAVYNTPEDGTEWIVMGVLLTGLLTCLSPTRKRNLEEMIRDLKK